MKSIEEELAEDPDATNIFLRAAARGSISVGDLNVSPDLDPTKVRDALGKLVSLGLLQQSGFYYSLSAVGASVARDLARQQKRFL